MTMTDEEPRDGDDVVIVHPQYGTLYMEDVNVCDEKVDGTVYETRRNDPSMKPGVNRVPHTMNFPKTCIKRVYHS